MKEKEFVTYTVRLPREILNKIKKLAEDDSRPVSFFVVKALREFCDRNDLN